jgi:hypothetical protein
MADGELMMTSEERVLNRPMLWAGLLLPVTAWILHLSLSYLLATTACTTADPVLHVLTVVLLAAAAAGGWMAWMSWNALRADSNGSSDQRALARFLAMLALLAAGLFGLTILTQGIPAIIIDPCL